MFPKPVRPGHTRAIYEFWNNSRVKADDIIHAHKEKTIERLQGQDTILAIQGTTDLDFTKYPYLNKFFTNSKVNLLCL